MFHIIDDWYIVVDRYSWMLARRIGEQVIKGKPYPKWADETYHTKPDDLINTFLDKYARIKAAETKETGELSDFLIFLSSEYKRAREAVESAFAEMREGRRVDSGEH